jgi:DNA-binding response OmpR family regulator
MASSSISASSNPPGPLILIVEDEALISLDISTYLQDHGFATRMAADGHEGIRLANEEPPALIITDIVMAGVDGLELIKRLRAAGLKTPIIAISGAIAKYDILGVAKRLGADAALPKPLHNPELLETVHLLLRHFN